MINVLIATRNGGQWIGLCLDSYLKLQPPSGGYKIIIVDNGSSDHSAAIIKSYQDKLPITLLYCATPGRNRAFNVALPHLEGDLVVFSDDDVIISPGWLGAYEEAAAHYPEIDVFAGQVRHHWQKKPPKWLVEMAAEGRAYAGTRIDRRDGPIEATQVKGSNFMVRRAVLARFPLDETIGPDGTRNYATGSETSLLRSMEQAGISFRFVAAACVQHIVRPHQVSLRAMIARYFRVGRGAQRMGLKDAVSMTAATMMGYPRYALGMILRLIMKAMFCALRADTVVAAKKLIAAATIAGAAYEARQQRRNTKLQ